MLDVMIARRSGSEDRCAATHGGKSELLRAAGWITSRRGDATESATERYRLRRFLFFG
jgi:hypothetical protein